MESTSIYKYRIKKRWKVNSSSGDKVCKFYPQYRSKLYGWRNMFQSYDFVYEKSTLLPEDSASVVIVSVFGAIIGIMGIFLAFTGMFFTGSSMFFGSLTTIYLSVYLVNKYSTEDILHFDNMAESKRFISKRINELKKKQKTKKKVHVSKEKLPEDEVFYLDIKVERAEKLKKINRRYKLKWK